MFAKIGNEKFLDDIGPFPDKQHYILRLCNMHKLEQKVSYKEVNFKNFLSMGAAP